MTNDSGDKYLEVDQLVALLATLDANYRLYPNQVGNLAIRDADDSYIGFVDFILEGSVELNTQ